MDALKELRDIVEQLAGIDKKGTTGRSERIRLLQKLNEKLLSEYYIKIDENFKIYPLLVEAYYYHEGKFEDGSTHGSKNQKGKDRFGKLYFHEKGRGGVDICLSCGDYALSFLIKNSMVDRSGVKKFCSQTELNSELNSERKRDRIVLCNAKEEGCKLPGEGELVILHTVRRGLCEIENRLSDKKLSENDRRKYEKALPFVYERLAAVKGFALRDPDGKLYPLALESGYSRGAIVAEYVHACAKCKQMTDREIDEMVEKLLGKGNKKSSIKRELELLE